MGYSPWGHKESDMAKQLTLVQSQFISFVPGDPVVPRNAPVCARARWEKFSPQLFCAELEPGTVTVVSLPEWWWYRRKCSGDIWEKLSLNFDRNKPDNHRLAGFFSLGALSCVFDGGGGLLAKLFWFFWDPLDYSPPGSFVHRILQARTLEYVAISFSRGSSWPRDQIRVSCIADGFFTDWASREAHVFFYLWSKVRAKSRKAYWRDDN